jgi:hypothetical protein
MTSIRCLLAVGLLIATVSGCANQNAAGRADHTKDQTDDFGNFGYDNMYRYYGGLSAVSEEFDLQHHVADSSTRN